MEFISNGKKFKREKKKRIFRLSSFRNFIKILLLISVLLSCFVFTSNNNLERSLNDIQDIEQVDRFFGLNPSTNDNFFKFIVGVSNNPYTIDPVDCWDSLSIQYIDQVCEGLYSYNLSDAELSIVPNLAADYGVVMINATDTWYTVELKTGIYFHDGYPFNATAVKFSFDRLQFLCNHTGLLPSHIPRATPHTVYEFTDGTPIINRTVILNSTAVRFELNKPFAPFQSLLCFFGSYILSPLSTNASGYINLGSDDLVGTGPFIYDRYDVDEAVRFHANDLYWRGKPKIEILELKIITDLNQRNNALIDGSIDLLDDPAQSFFSTFQSDPTVNFIDTGKAMNLFYYLSMNNNKINETWRQAISHAINYTCIIEKFRSGVVKRAKSPIPENMIYSNWTNNIATFNITKARELMQTMGYGVGWDTTYPGTAEGNWTAASFANFNYSYNLGSSFREKILVLLQNNLSKIGINVIDDGMDYSDFIQKLFDPGQYDYFELVFSGWGSDYNDPNSIVELLFSNTSSSNLALVNDAYLQDLINQGMIEYDAGTRRNIYNEIQRYLVEDLMPWAYCYSPINYDAYRSYVLGFQSNPIDKLVLYNVSRDPSYGSERIHIEGNQEWEFLKNASFCTGQGTRLDPYVIKDYVIDGQNAPLSCIQIENSDVFFRIENCTVFNSGAVGIELVNTSRGQIILNNCSNNYSGIYLDGGCFNNTLISNYIDSNSQYGIILNVTTGNFVFNNSFISNFINGYDNGVGNFWNNGSLGNYWDDYTGIDENDDGIGDSPYNVLGIAGSQDYNPIWFDGFEANLLIFLNGLNITLIEITPNALLNISVRYEERVSGNFISGASVGLSDGPISANLTENVILERYYLVINTSILGLGFHSIDISAQKENFASISIAIGVNVSSYIALSSFIIDDMGGGDYTWSQAETQSWCSGSGTISDPYHIQNLYLYGAYSSNCLTIRFSTAFFVISNCFFYQSRREEGYAGIKLENVSNGNLTGITCSDNENGIYLLSSEFITISESYIQNNRHAGIILNGSSYNLIVDNPVINNNYYGIFMFSSHHNTVLRNKIGFNRIGLYLVQSNYNNVNYNTFDQNQEAIVEVDSHGNDLSNNTIISFVIDNALIFTGVIIGILSVVAVIAMKSVTQAKKKKELELISGTDELKRKLDIREQFGEKDDEKLIEATAEAKKSMEQIYFSVFSQKTVPPDSDFMLYVWAYLLDERSKLNEIASMGGDLIEKGLSGGIPGSLGDEFKVELILPAPFEIDEKYETIIWIGSMTNVSFIVNVPEDIKIGTHKGQVKIYYDGILYYTIKFVIEIGERQTKIVRTLQDIERINKYFASYSSKDRVEVMKRLQGFKLRTKADVFMDCLSTKPGEKWEKRIYEEIRNSDKFLLFWSLAAKKSKWVEKEWKFAFREYGLDFIQPVPLENPSIVKPPKELEKLHFDDIYLILIKGIGESFNIFLCCSSLEAEKFQISKIADELEAYPKIKNVFHLQPDKTQEELMEMLESSNVFIFVCSEYCMKSAYTMGNLEAALEKNKNNIIEIVLIFENEEFIPARLRDVKNVRYIKREFSTFIEELYNTIARHDTTGIPHLRL